jgi:hypothetical protein
MWYDRRDMGDIDGNGGWKPPVFLVLRHEARELDELRHLIDSPWVARTVSGSSFRVRMTQR